MKYRSLGLALALAIGACGERGGSSPENDASPEAVLALLQNEKREACEAALPLVADEILKIEYEYGWEWVAETLKQRTAITGRDAKFVSYDPGNRSMRCEAQFDIMWVDGTSQGAVPEPGADGYYLVPKDGGFVIRLTAPEAGAQWNRPQGRVRYAAMRDHVIAESVQRSALANESSFVPDEPFDEESETQPEQLARSVSDEASALIFSIARENLATAKAQAARGNQFFRFEEPRSGSPLQLTRRSARNDDRNVEITSEFRNVGTSPVDASLILVCHIGGVTRRSPVTFDNVQPGQYAYTMTYFERGSSLDYVCEPLVPAP